MSFLKITDPNKRDFIVEEFLKTKKNVRQNFLSEKLGDFSLQNELSKLYKPITDSQTQIAKEQKALSLTTSKVLEALPATISSSLSAIKFPQYPSIEAYERDDAAEDAGTMLLGSVAAKYLQQWGSKNKKMTDTTFGIYDGKDGQFYIGDSPITIQGDNLIVGDKEYVGTPGLWELLTMSQPNKTIYDQNDLSEYAEILDVTNAMRQTANPSKPKSSASNKYREIIRPIWNEKRQNPTKTGEGIKTIIIPEDPNALVEMLALRISSLKAGNTGVKNEIVSICDELLRQNVITKNQYKNLMLQI